MLVFYEFGYNLLLLKSHELFKTKEILRKKKKKKTLILLFSLFAFVSNAKKSKKKYNFISSSSPSFYPSSHKEEPKGCRAP